jgi:hypothetical protein
MQQIDVTDRLQRLAHRLADETIAVRRAVADGIP